MTSRSPQPGLKDQADKNLGAQAEVTLTVQNDQSAPSVVSHSPAAAAKLPSLPNSITLTVSEMLMADPDGTGKIVVAMGDVTKQVPWTAVVFSAGTNETSPTVTINA
jgi:hypothetical protein